MNNFSVRAHLEETHQVSISREGKLVCPFCQHPTMGLKGDELAKCFHPSCGRFINAYSVQSDREHLQQFMWDFMHAGHQELIKQAEVSETRHAYRYLTEERRVHSQVIGESPVLGIVPTGFEFESRCAHYRQRLQEEANPGQLDGDLKAFDTHTETLRKLKEKHPNWLMFGYTDSNHRLCSLKFREPYGKRFSLFKPLERAGVFNLQLFETNGDGLWPYLLLTEGEFNVLTLQSLLAENSLSYCKALALGGASSVDWQTLKRFREQWLLFQDNDTAGHAMAKTMQSHRTFRLIRSNMADEDLDCFIRRFQKPQEALGVLKQAIGQAEPKYRFLEAIGDSINAIRRKEKKKLLAFEINQQVGHIMGKELKDRGIFYRTAIAPYFLDEETRTLYLLSKGSRDTQRYLHRFTLNPAESIHKFVLNDLERIAFEEGRETRICQFCHYDRESNRLYLFNRDTEVYRISENAIDVVPNGTDGVLFEPLTDYQPFTREEVESEADQLSDLYIQQVNLEQGALSVDEYRMLLETWVYHLFFDGLHATHPIAAFIGPKGSSKTSSVRRLGLLLFGAGFQVSPIPDKADDFDAIVTNGFLVGFDNVDGQTQWLNDKLAIVATGGCVKRRELYSTNNLVGFPIRARVAITSRTPKFRREDVAERVLPFPLKTLEQKVSERHLMDKILAQRDQFMSWLLLRLQEILRMLAKTEGLPAIETDLRMADFGSFMIRLAMADGVEEQAKDMIWRLTKAQSQFTLEQDPLFELLEILAREHPARRYTTADLHQALTQIAARTGIRYNYKSANSLGQKIGHLKTNLEQMLDVHIDSGSGNTKIYSFRPKSMAALNALQNTVNVPTKPDYEPVG